MKKNTFNIKHHFNNLCRLALVVLFISVFTEVSAQSSGSKNAGTTPVSVQPTVNGTPQSSLENAPAPVPSEAVVNELKAAQPEPGTMNATTTAPAAPAAVQQQVAPAAQQNQEKKQTGKKQPK